MWGFTRKLRGILYQFCDKIIHFWQLFTLWFMCTLCYTCYAYIARIKSFQHNLIHIQEEYYHLLAEKIYKIQKELEEKRQRRLHQQIRSTLPQITPQGKSTGIDMYFWLDVIGFLKSCFTMLMLLTYC